MKRLRFTGLLLVLAIIISLLPTGALAADPLPPTPHRFYGMLTLRNLDGSVSIAAPNGMGVSAWIGGVEKDTGITFGGSYGLTESGNILQLVGNSGDTVVFRVNGVDTGQTYPWASGGFTNLNLTVTDSVTPTIAINDIPSVLSSLTEVSGTAVDILGIAKVQIAVNSVDKAWSNASSNWVTGTDVLWFDASGTTTWTSIVPSLAGGQSYTVSARAIDLVGNISLTVSDNFFIEDIVPPATPLLLSPADNLYTTFTTHTFLWTAVTDPAGVSYELQVDNNADFSSPEINATGLVDTNYISSALLDGNYNWRVRSIDGALNASPWSAVRSLNIDTGLPSVVITPLLPDPNNDSTPTLGGTAADLISPIASVEYRVDGGSWIAAAASDGAFNSTTEGYTFTTNVLADGVHQVEVRATDILGFSTAAENYAGDTFTVDTIAPSISGIKSGGITATGATISWNTIEPATSQIEFGTASATHGNYGSNASVPGFSAVHGVALSGLVLGNTYYYRVISVDEAGNQTVSAEFSFSTQSDLTPPVISDVTAAGLTPSSAIIMWNTDEESTSQVEYGTASAAHGSYPFGSPLNASLVIGHGASLTGLAANTTYYFRVISRDAIGNQTVSGEFNFKTSPDETLPVISGVLVTNITTTSAIIKWLTNEPANSRIEYGLTIAYGSTIALDPAMVFIHSKSISGLAPSSIYHYRIRSADAAGNEAVSANMTFTTLADSTPPGIFTITEIDITTTDAWITWITGEAATAQVAYDTVSHAIGAYSDAAAVLVAYSLASAKDPTLGLGHGIGLSDLTPNTIYYYRVISLDGFGNASWSAEDSFTTLADNIPPVISDIIESDITTSDAWVLWFTDEPATSQVAYGATSHVTGAYGSAAEVLADYAMALAKDTTMSIYHGIGLSDLTPNTAYFYRVISIDAFGNESISAEESFTTLPDTASPAISDIIETGITQTSAILYWNTDEPATSRVEYGIASAAHGGYAKITSLDTTLVFIHGVVLSGLTPNTTYYYRVISQDASGNEVWSDEDSFTTLADETPPAITGIMVPNITDTMAIIYWNTNEKATTRVEYGKTASYDKLTPLNIALIFNHGVVISGLTPNTEYHFRVKSSDAYGNEGVSEDNTFNTKPDATPPTFAGVTATSVTGSSAVISWTTNEKSTTRVEFGESTAYGSLSLLNANLVLNHSVLLVGLTSGTEYHYRALSSDASGNAGQSADFTFNTVPDTVPPAISGIIEVNVTDTSAVILWLTDEPSDSQVEYGLTSASHGGYDSETTLDATPVTSHGVALGGLAVGNTYYYRVVSKDADGNESVSDEGSFATADATAPDITSVLSVAITSSGAVIVWITDENATTQVVYGTTSHVGATYANAAAAVTAYGASTIEDGALIPSHGVVLSGLTSATTYYYRVISRDAALNETISVEFSFTTT